MATLCRRCESFDIQAFKDVANPWRGYRVRDVKQAADEGCNFCSSLVELLPAAFDGTKRVGRLKIADWVHFRPVRDTDYDLSPDARVGSDLEAADTKDSMLRITHIFAGVAAQSGGDGPSLKLVIKLHAAADPGDPASISGDVVGIYTGKKTDSIYFVERINKWLESCSGHARCSRSLSGSREIHQRFTPLPTRCIAVQKTKDGLHVCLQDTAGEVGTYITLSHRWGTSTSQSMTTATNLASRLRGEMGPFGDLPKLFTDSFHLAGELGIQYVWIDSLCIVQGDADEWETESVKMADYYQNSIFTVASPDATEESGLFHASDEVDLIPTLTRLPYRDRSGQAQGYFYVYPTDREIQLRYWKAITLSALLSRGWVFQEWMLSRRMVCFTRSGLFLQCKEDYPQTEVGEVVTNRVKGKFFVDLSIKRDMINFDLALSDGIYEAWELVVEAYSGLSLTKPQQDRLVALGGIADEFGLALEKRNAEAQLQENAKGKSPSRSPFTHRTYAAGLWLASIQKGLMWEQIKAGRHKRISSIPTWSWASICAEVKWSDYLTDSIKSDCKVVDVLNPKFDELSMIDDPSFVNSQLELPGDRGAVPVTVENPRSRFPVLLLQGKLQPVILGGRFTPREATNTAYVTCHAPDFGRTDWRGVASPLDPGFISGWVSVEHPDFQDDDAVLGEQRPVFYALHISRITNVLGGIALGYLTPKYSVYNVILVQKAQTVTNGYERVGVGRLFGREFDRGFDEALERTVRFL